MQGYRDDPTNNRLSAIMSVYSMHWASRRVGDFSGHILSWDRNCPTSGGLQRIAASDRLRRLGIAATASFKLPDVYGQSAAAILASGRSTRQLSMLTSNGQPIEVAKLASAMLYTAGVATAYRSFLFAVGSKTQERAYDEESARRGFQLCIDAVLSLISNHECPDHCRGGSYR